MDPEDGPNPRRSADRREVSPSPCLLRDLRGPHDPGDACLRVSTFRAGIADWAPGRRGWWLVLLSLSISLSIAPPRLRAAVTSTPTELRGKLLAGEYEEVVRQARRAVNERPRQEEWHLLLLEGLMSLGKYAEAHQALTNALDRSPRTLPLRWLARDVFQQSGLPEAAAEQASIIVQSASDRPWAYREPLDLVTVGRAMVALGADPKEILERIHLAARKVAPDLRETYLAAGELALAKHDAALAARQFDEGLKKFPTDPNLLAGRARAFLDGDRKEMAKSLEAALEANPRHIPSLLLLAEHRIDAEDYEAASGTLKEIQAFNPALPEAWAFLSVIAHLRNDRAAEAAARAAASRTWRTNPGVPHLIGRKLSQKYRFAEGAALQREALRFDPDHMEARAQLASDLLRLGEEAEGWDLVQQVHAADAYDVTAFNLATLRDTMGSFATLTNEHFIVRLSTKEAAVYGARVLDLLERARTNLAPRYGHHLTLPTIVEIFPNPRDFGVRTFGMPDNPGYLGVCFGRVITANSPASSRGNAINWEAVLWHEFCHVITLQLTANKMPRWLSEGLSVYEERRANPAWGEQLNPRYREMILGKDLTPVGRLSAAFLTPKSPAHLQFAYYQSSLVIEYLVEQFGFPKVVAILNTLHDGAFINDAIAAHTAPMETIETEFAAFARARAEAFTPGLDWSKPEDNLLPPGLAALAEKLPGAAGGAKGPSYSALREDALRHLEARRWAEAKVPLSELVRLYPRETGADSSHSLLAQAHRALGETALERAALARWAEVDAAAPDAYTRLMELAAADGDWPEVLRNAQRFLAVNPLVPAPYRQLARASAALGDLAAAVGAHEAILHLDPPNPPEVHYELARLLAPAEPARARRHLIEALEDAPRHRAGLALLLQLDAASPPPP